MRFIFFFFAPAEFFFDFLLCLQNPYISGHPVRVSLICAESKALSLGRLENGNGAWGV